MNERWTIDQLAAVVQEALATTGGNGQPSARVRTLPDARTIRYYTTLGILSPPVEMRGRKAFYSRPHVFQLVAIKRLQARGLSLVRIQEALTGAEAQSLERLAAIPDDLWQRASDVATVQRELGMAIQAQPEASARAGAVDRGRFWVAEPETERPPKVPPDAVLPVSPAVHVAVAGGVELVIRGIDPTRLDAAAFVRLRPLLQNLADSLRQLELLPEESRGGYSPQDQHK